MSSYQDLRRLATARTPGAAPQWPPPLTDSREHRFDVTEAPYYAALDTRTTTTSGTTPVGTTVALSSDIGLVEHHGIFIAGAGVAGADYVGTVTASNGTLVIVSPATSTQVAAGAIVRHDDSAAINAAIADAGMALGGTVRIPGHAIVNGPFLDPLLANGILVLPSLFYGAGMHPIEIVIEGLPNSTWSDQGPLGPSSIIETHKADAAGTGAVLSGYCDSSTPWGKFTACFLKLRNICIRVPANPAINGVNAYNIGRVQCEGNVVVDTGHSYGPNLSHDKYAFRAPAFNSVPPSHIAALTIAGFKRGLLSYDRVGCDYLYSSYCEYPIQTGTGSTYIGKAVIDVCKAGVSTLAGGGLIKIDLMAIDQADFLLIDTFNNMYGDITYARGAGQLAISGGAHVLVKKIGSSATTFAPSGGAVTRVAPDYQDQVHTFTASGDFIVNKAGTVRVLVVGAGGSGLGSGSGGNSGQGGAGGQVVEIAELSVDVGTIHVTVGAGGLGAINASNAGGDSSFGATVASGGAGGIGHTSTPPGPSGGAGAGGAGGVGNSTTGGAGGVGAASDISGASVYYGGGGGGGWTNGGAGGSGGGGAGSNYNAKNGAAGTVNTGGGGGGASQSGDWPGYAGGSGIVIVRYSPQP